MILTAFADELRRRWEDGFKGRHFEAWPIIRTVSSYLRYP